MYTLTLHIIDKKGDEIYKPVFDNIRGALICLESYIVTKSYDVVFAITKDHKVVMTGYLNKENIDV